MNRTTCPGRADNPSVYLVTGQSDGHGTLLKECVSGCPLGRGKEEEGAGHPASGLSDIEQTVDTQPGLTPEQIDAISDALADALVADYLAELAAMVGSPRGLDRG